METITINSVPGFDEWRMAARACLAQSIPPENIIVEPCARNTAAAIGLAAIHVKRRNKNGIMVVLPADPMLGFIRIPEGLKAQDRSGCNRMTQITKQ